ncbi:MULTISPECIES: hypothetical protein [unclassified Rathayibacter]|uniref:hypothetical protein n=1 Tax=unclassified Rathayibacter TaxID=2609250 RepID=UPI0011B094C8|nr:MULTISPECIES: hypothetical protein [unclassified Rathayibacter]
MSSSTMRLMPVEAPAATLQRRSAATAERLARHAAVLSGVNVPGNEVRRTWVKRFEALTLKELSRGVAAKDDALAQGEIAAATLNRFRPNRKSAAFLTGAEVLFSSLGPVFGEVMRTVGYNELNEPLVEEIRAAIWAVMVLECYRSQPALFVSATTARAVQRALSLPWEALQPAGRDEERTATLPAPGENPTTLSILDETIKLVLDDNVLDQEGDGRPGEGASEKFLREDLISRWLKHLLESPDRGFAWVHIDTERQNGKDVATGLLRVEAFTSPLGSLNAFVDEVSRSDVGRAHADRLLPRIPSAGELRRLNPAARRMCVWVVIQIHRLLRDNFRMNDLRDHEQLKTAVVVEAQRLTELAEAVLEPGDPLVVWARAKWRNKLIADLRDEDPAAAMQQLELLRADIDEMVALHGAGRVDNGAIADFVRSLSPIINAIADDADDRGEDVLFRRLHDDLGRDWETFFAALGLQPAGLLPDSQAPDDPSRRAVPALLAGHLHNFAAFLSRSHKPEDRTLGIRLQKEVVIPARAEAREQHGVDLGLRVALQVLIRALVIEHEQTDDPKRRRELAADAVRAAEQVDRLRDFTLTAVDGFGVKRLRGGQVNTLTAIVAGFAIAKQNGIPTGHLTSSEVRMMADRAADYLLARSPHGVPSGRLRQFERLRAKLVALEAG